MCPPSIHHKPNYRSNRLVSLGLMALVLTWSGSLALGQGRSPRSIRGAGRTAAVRGIGRMGGPGMRTPTATPIMGALGGAMSGTGMTAADIRSFLNRPRLLMMNSSYSGPLRRLNVSIGIASFKYTANQDEIDAAIEKMMESDPPKSDYAAVLANEMRSQRRHLMQNGWSYVKESDFLRARAAFEAAELVDVRSPVPRFGQLIVDVSQRHFRRAMTKLAAIMSHDTQRPPNMPGMFEYNVALQRMMKNEDEFIDLLIELRQFAQLNLENPPVQGLVCYVLWYSRYPDAIMEAKAIAARLSREPMSRGTVWGQFSRLMLMAERKILAAQQRAVAARAAQAESTARPSPGG